MSKVKFTLVVEVDEADSALPYNTMLAAMKEGATVVEAEVDYKGHHLDCMHMVDTIKWCMENSNE